MDDTSEKTYVIEILNDEGVPVYRGRYRATKEQRAIAYANALAEEHQAGGTLTLTAPDGKTYGVFCSRH
jgi:hypothetical protein